MNRLLIASLLCSLFATASCSMLAGEENTKSVAPGAITKGVEAGSINVNEVLSTVKDKPTAQAAKGPLEAALASLKGLMGKADAGSTGVEDASGGMGKMATDALAKFGIDGNTIGMVTGLLKNPAVASVIGPALEQLKGLLPMK